jgi:nitrite reductase (cytochrome c-552)
MEGTRQVRTLAYVIVALVAALVTAGVAALLVSVFEHKQEARQTYVKLVEVTEDDVDPAKWGVNFPRQYDGYRRTSEPSATKYGGGLVGPEGTMPPQKSERDPWLKRIFAGYLFAVDYRDRRGHAFMLNDQEVTKRNVPAEGKQSGNCLHCHASIMPLYRKLGAEALPQGTPKEQVQKGLEKVSELSYWDAHEQLGTLTKGVHPVSCVDCHDPKTNELRVTRPGFVAGIQALAASDAPVPHLPSIEAWRKGPRAANYDPNVDGTRQEMRSYVCGQCHVEYYCGKGLTLLFPWDRGLKAEQIEASYDAREVHGARFKDWVHAETGFEVLKAQHPEFETWSQGVHARSGVACADCHMPYKREGAMKVSEHWVRSPLLQINRSCETCHPYGEQELKARVEGIQDRHFELMTRAGQAAVALIDEVVPIRKAHDERTKAEADTDAKRLAAWQATVKADPALAEIAELQRAAQWRLDFVAAENSMGFHAPQEAARLLGESIDLSRQAQVKAVAWKATHLPATSAPTDPASPAPTDPAAPAPTAPAAPAPTAPAAPAAPPAPSAAEGTGA